VPTAAEALTPQSTDEEYRQAVSECIRQLTEEGGREPAQIQAICYAQARRATGRPYPRVRQQRGTRITGEGETPVFRGEVVE